MSNEQERMPLIHSATHVHAPRSVYADRLDPASPTGRTPVVMIHGGAHTGSCYLRTARGAPGWAYDFVARGYPAIVPDWPGIGRSGSIPLDQLTGEVVVEGLRGLIESIGEPVILVTHSMSGCYGWRLAELCGDRIRAIVGVAPSPPGNIQPQAKVISETTAALEIETFGRRMTIDKTALNFPTAATITDKYIGKSRFFPREHLAEYTASLSGLPPRILAQRRNINGTQVRVEDPSRLAGLRALIVTATDDIDHPRDVDEQIATWLNQQGARVEFCYLADRGITGNGHMMMLEDNSRQIAAIMLDWLDALH